MIVFLVILKKIIFLSCQAFSLYLFLNIMCFILFIYVYIGWVIGNEHIYQCHQWLWFKIIYILMWCFMTRLYQAKYLKMSRSTLFVALFINSFNKSHIDIKNVLIQTDQVNMPYVETKRIFNFGSRCCWHNKHYNFIHLYASWHCTLNLT